ncbi:sigma factor G inhibitor Gin [Cerasibacillus terrae]|uniref:Sigma factor G inhibitor Gin n=1 Tax=Cerasibacillus terrae TaxID=2498845 RepID=A0A5C8NNW8_9BACI|nr:sigma factor G inhibitor Gin [Cerasibacillus terrae]TXL63419.1 sigma factor G inhibitor Gin [Cerasibacillus terrae]
MGKQALQWEKCGICDERKERGIHLYTMYICCDCEHQMIHTEPSEEKYRYYIQKLKHMNQSTLFS